VFCSFLQIYNEKVFDLLNPSSVGGLTALRKMGNAQFDKDQGGLRIRWTKKDQFVVENLYVFECSSYEEAIKLFKFGS
jgi:epoxyqueuosine reductase QueG